ncbi:hypothetical protein DAI22_11g161100 [Oryza sativa Japonica Group]|nr:hypothetical protein DAI22_11g161100 [Oryza sativa Japonica Group]
MKIGTIIGIALPATGAAIAIATLCSYIRRKRLARKTSIPGNYNTCVVFITYSQLIYMFTMWIWV